MSGLFMRAMDAVRMQLEPSAREFTEDLAYFHLSVARDARVRMDRMAWSLEYAELHESREHAIEGAKRQFNTLRNGRHEIPELLLTMARNEGIEP